MDEERLKEIYVAHSVYVDAYRKGEVISFTEGYIHFSPKSFIGLTKGTPVAVEWNGVYLKLEGEVNGIPAICLISTLDFHTKELNG